MAESGATTQSALRTLMVGIARRPCEDGGACEWSGMERGINDNLRWSRRLRLNHDL